MNVLYEYMNLCAWEMNIKKDILVQKIKVKKSIFQFLAPSFCYFFANVHTISEIEESTAKMPRITVVYP